MMEQSWMMGDDEMKDSNRMFQQPTKRQRHSNVGLANYMGWEPNLAPCSKGSAPVCPNVCTHSCGQGGVFEALGSSTESGKPKVKFLQAITKKLPQSYHRLVCAQQCGRHSMKVY